MSIWIRILMTVNVFLYRLTDGALGSRMSGQSVLLLNTVGRKSGVPRTTPVNYYPDGERYVLVASNWGKGSHPAWYLNLMQQGAATIQVKNRKLRVRAMPAEGEEYQRLWRYVTGLNDFYVRYQKQTQRQIPLVILTPEN